MDKSKSGRALNSAEKAEADAPTNKQWLDTIGRPPGRRRRLADSAHPRPPHRRQAPGTPPMIVRFR